MHYNSNRPILFNENILINKVRQIYYNAKARANKQDLEFNIDYNWIYNNISSMKCQLTGIDLNINYNSGGVVQYNSISIHRIKPNLGYVKNNCLIINNALNMFISNHNIEDILYLSQLIVNNNNYILQKHIN